MLISTAQLNITTLPTSGSANTSYLRGLCHQIVVKPFNEDTQYDVIVINPAGIVVYERNDESGTLSEITSMPVHGVYTVDINGASNAEAFLIQIIIQE